MTRLYLKLFAVAIAVLVADQLTKSWALESFRDEPLTLIDGVLTLRITYNTGGAFGIGQGNPQVFLVATIIAAIVILVWVRSLEQPSWTIPLGLVLGGGFGNVYDRVFRDVPGVVDFVDLHVWPVFNLADVCIVTGVGIVLLMTWRHERRAKRENATPPPDDGSRGA